MVSPPLNKSQNTIWLTVGYTLFFIVLWACLFLPFLSQPELEKEEPRRIIPTLEMSERGDWLRPTIGGEPYLNKPPGINWLIGGSFRLFGISEWAARLPSSFLLLVASLAAWFYFRRDLGDHLAVLFPAFLLLSATILSKARLAEIDAALTATNTVLFIVWISLMKRPQRGLWWRLLIAYTALTVGLFLKGPVILLFWIPLLIAPHLTGSGKCFKPSIPHLTCALMAFALFGAWAIAANPEASPDDESMTSNALNEIAERFRATDFELSAYLLKPLRFLGGLCPWIFPLVFALAIMKKERRLGKWMRTQPALHILILTSLGLFATLVALPNFLPRYLLPMIPWVAYITAYAFKSLSEAQQAYYRTFTLRTMMIVAIASVPAALIASVRLWGILADPFRVGVIVGALLLTLILAILFSRFGRSLPFLPYALLFFLGAAPLGYALVNGHKATEAFYAPLAQEIREKTGLGDEHRLSVHYTDQFVDNGVGHFALLYYLHPTRVGERGSADLIIDAKEDSESFGEIDSGKLLAEFQNISVWQKK